MIKLSEISGSEATMYSVIVGNEEVTLFERFVEENKVLFKSEIRDIVSRLWVIGHDTGARESYFKVHEGALQDGLVALYDNPDKRLRLYAIRYGADILVLGGGGMKDVRTLQQDPKLKSENYLLRAIAKELNQKIKDREITFSANRLEFNGELNFEIDE